MTITVTSNEPVAANAAVKATEETSKSAPVETSAEQSESVASDTTETEAKEAADESEESAESEDSEGNEDAEKEDKPKKKSGAQRRKERAERAEAEVERLRKLIEERAFNGAGDSTAKKDETKATAAKAEPADKPKIDDFETHAEYVEALTDWKLEQRDKAKAAEAEKSRLKSEHETKVKAYSERYQAFSKSTPDFEDVTAEVSDIPVSAAFESLIIESESGPEIFYELAKTPDEFARIGKLSPLACAREIGKIEARIASKATEAPKHEPKKITNAPKPLTPVAAKGASVQKSLDDPNLSQKEFEAIVRKQMAARNAW